MRSLLFSSVLCCAWGAGSADCGASPSVESVAPGIGQRGTEFQLKLIGAGLKDAAEVMLYSLGVKCESCQAASDNELIVRLRAAAECPLGTHAFRVRTPQGISELRTFRVTPFPIVAAEEPNETFAEAKPLSGNVTVAGVIESGDVDCFRVTLSRGDRLAAEVEAIRMGGPMLDVVLTILGPDGQPIVTVDDTSLFHQDPFTTIVAPADGSYVVQVRETNFEGDENSRYALHVGTFPRPAFVYPAGGRAGQTTKVRFGGDAAGSFDQEVHLPAAASGFFALFPVQQGLAAPTPNRFRASPFDNLLEAEPNDTPTDADGKAAPLPVAFNGILQRAGDVDCFRFQAAAGVRYQLEAFAARLGSPVDTVLSILDGHGSVLISNDDDESHDSRLMFVVPQSADYVLQIADKRGSGGANCVYRVEAAQLEPQLSAFLPRPNRLSQERQAIAVPRGNRVVARLAAQRLLVEGDVGLQMQGLPAGASSSETNIPSDHYWMPVVLEALGDAPLGGTFVDVLATSNSGGRTVTGRFVQVVDLVAGSADALFHSVNVERLAVAVVEEAPFKISIDPPRAALSQDGTIGLTIRVERLGDFASPVDVTFPLLPPSVDGPAKITIPAEQSAAVYTARAFPQAEPRTWRLCAEAKPGIPAAGNAAGEPQPGAAMYRRARRPRSTATFDTAVSSQLVSLQVAEPPVMGTIATIAAEPGTTVNIVCDLDRRGELPPQLTATLEGLPNRVNTSPVAMSRDDRRVVFAVALDPTAPLGSFSSLVCRLSGVIGGQEVSYYVGRGGVLKIEPAGTLVKDDSGRALSPLEALRRAQRSVGAQK